MEEPSQLRLWDWAYQATVLSPLIDITKRYNALNESERKERTTEFRNALAGWGHRHLRNRWSTEDERAGNTPEKIIFAHAFSGQTLVRLSALVDARIESPGGELVLVLKHLMYLDLETGRPQLHPSIKYAEDRKDPTWLPLYFPGYDREAGDVRGHPQIHSVTAYDATRYKSVTVHQSRNEFPRLNVRAHMFAFERFWVAGSLLHTQPVLGNQKVADAYLPTIQEWNTFSDVVSQFRAMETGAANTKKRLPDLWRGRSYDLMAYGHSNVAVWGSVFIAEDRGIPPNQEAPYRLVVDNVYATSMPAGWGEVKRHTDRDPTEASRMTQERLAAMVPVGDVLQMEAGTIRPNKIFEGVDPPTETTVRVYFDPLFEDGLPFYYYRKYELTSDDVAAMIESERAERRQHMLLMLRAKAWVRRALPAYISKVLPQGAARDDFAQAAVKYLTASARVWFNSNPTKRLIEDIGTIGTTVYGPPRLPRARIPAVNFVVGIYEAFVENVFPRLRNELANYPQVLYREEAAPPEDEGQEGERRLDEKLDQSSREAEERQRKEQEEEQERRRKDEEELKRVWDEAIEHNVREMEEEQRREREKEEQQRREREKEEEQRREREKEEQERSKRVWDEAVERARRKVEEKEEEERRQREREKEEEPQQPVRETEEDDPFGIAIDPPQTADDKAISDAARDLRDRMGGLDRDLWFSLPDRIDDGAVDRVRGAVDACIQRRGITEQRILDYPGRVGTFLVGFFSMKEVELSAQKGVGGPPLKISEKMVAVGGVRMDPGCQRQVLGAPAGPSPVFIGMAFPSAYRGKRRRGIWYDQMLSPPHDIMIDLTEPNLFGPGFVEVDFSMVSRQEVAKWLATARGNLSEMIPGVTLRVVIVSPKFHVSAEGNVVGWLTIPDEISEREGFPRGLVSGIMGGNIVGTDTSKFRLNYFFIDTQRGVAT